MSMYAGVGMSRLAVNIALATRTMAGLAGTFHFSDPNRPEMTATSPITVGGNDFQRHGEQHAESASEVVRVRHALLALGDERT